MMQDPSICSDVTLSIEGANQNVEFAKISLIVQPTKRQPSIRPAIMTSFEDVSKRSTPTPRTTQTVTQLSTLHADDMSSVSDVTSVSSNTHVVQTTEVPRTSMGAKETSKSTSPTDVSPPAFSKVSFIDRCDRRVGCSVMSLTLYKNPFCKSNLLLNCSVWNGGGGS